MVGAPQKLDLDGVGGARLESMAAKAAKAALQDFLVGIEKVNITSERKQYLIAFQAQQSSVFLCRKD